MTAEVAIFNREGVALAADSAVTVIGPNGHKILTTANKIFALSKHHPVGIMVYGTATFLNIPWETLIKSYREELGTRSFGTLDEYSEGFLEFLRRKQPKFFPEDAQRAHIVAVASAYLRAIRHEIDDRVDAGIQARGVLTTRQIQKIVRETVSEWHEFVTTAKPVDAAPPDYDLVLRRRYGSLVSDGIGVILGGHARSAQTERLLRDALLATFGRHVPEDDPPEESGVVFAGFADDAVMPGLREYHVQGMAAEFLKVHLHLAADVSHSGTQAGIRPLAQSEMVVRFMEGVDPDYQDFVEQLIGVITEEFPRPVVDGFAGLTSGQRAALKAAFASATPDLVQHAQETLAEFRRRQYADPVTALVESLPKEDLAAMAESLVSLTSFKRRVSWDDETVGGPIDVAFISRGDGFVWIKRKHYFDAALNPHYFAAKYGGRRDAPD